MKPAPTKAEPKAPEMPQRITPPVAAQAAEPAPETNDVVRQAPTPELNPRNRVMAEISQRANVTADEVAAESVPEGDGESMPVAAAPAPTTAEPEETETAAPAAPAPVSAAPEAAPALPGIDPEGEYEFVVEGVKTKIKGSQVIARVQKSEAADYRLQEASRLFEEAKRVAGQPQLPAQGVAQPAAASQPVALDPVQLAHYIQFGTVEQAAEAIKQLHAQRPETVTKEGLREFMADIPRMLDAQLSLREGANLVKSQYNDIISDPDLRQLFFSKENAARAAGDKRAHVELYKEIGDGLRKRFNLSAPSATTPAITTPAPTAPAAQTIAQKQAAKAAAPAAPRLAAARLEGGSETQKPKTREDIINEMRQKRGQHALSVR